MVSLGHRLEMEIRVCKWLHSLYFRSLEIRVCKWLHSLYFRSLVGEGDKGA